MLNIVLFGPPGAGKGTQSAKLIEKYGLVHLSTGDIFRANMKGETELGQLAKSYIEKGQLVPDEVTISMLEAEVAKNPSAKGFIFDGFPRTGAQASALEKLLASKGSGISVMIALEVEEEELKRRLISRGQSSGRPDDADPAIIQNRINVYNTETAPVKAFYEAKNKYRGVNGIGSIGDIFYSLCHIVDDLVAPSMVVATLPPALEEKPAPVAMPAQSSATPAPKTVSKKVVVAKKETPVKKATAKKAPAKKKAVAKPVAKKVAKKAVKKAAPKKAAKKVVKKVAKKVVKKVAKKAVKKATPKKVVKKAAKKKVAPKKITKKVVRKVVKKAAPKKKPVKKVIKKTAKKGTAKKVARKVVRKAAAKKTAKKITKKVVKKAASKKVVKKAVKKVGAKKVVKKVVKRAAPKKAVKKATKKRRR